MAITNNKIEKKKRDAFRARLNELIEGEGGVEKFCEKTDIPFYELNQYIGDKGMNEPSRVTIDKICRSLMIDANWLVVGEGGLTALDPDALQLHIEAVDRLFMEYNKEPVLTMRRSRLRALLNECTTLIQATANSGEVPLSAAKVLAVFEKEYEVSLTAEMQEKIDRERSQFEEEKLKFVDDALIFVKERDALEREKASFESTRTEILEMQEDIESRTETLMANEELLLDKMNNMEVERAELDQIRDDLEAERKRFEQEKGSADQAAL